MTDTTSKFKLTEKTIYVWGRGLSDLERKILHLSIETEHDIVEISYRINLSQLITELNYHKAIRRIKKAYKTLSDEELIEASAWWWPIELLCIEQPMLNKLYKYFPNIKTVRDLYLRRVDWLDFQQLCNHTGKRVFSGVEIAELRADLQNNLEFNLPDNKSDFSTLNFSVVDNYRFRGVSRERVANDSGLEDCEVPYYCDMVIDKLK